MTSTFGRPGVQRISFSSGSSSSGSSSSGSSSSGSSWRRELAPVIAVAGLAADYLSPAALWTMLLPFGGVVLLLALRKPAYAAAVFLLSSWVLVPTAAQTVSAVEDLRGERRLYVVPDAEQTTLDAAVADPDVPASVGFQVLPIGPGHLVNPRWALRDVIVTFAELHNQLLIERWHDTLLRDAD
jgi:hypothetical protein